MPSTTPDPTPEIHSLIQACGPLINSSHAEELAQAFNPPARDGETKEPTAAQLEAVYETARSLCDQENFQFAAALGLHLFSYKPGEPRFAFLAGNCMQRLGMNASAAKFYCYALVSGGDHPGALFRLGECLLALGDKANADKAFDAALDVSRDDSEAGEILDQSHQFITMLRAGSGPAHER